MDNEHTRRTFLKASSAAVASAGLLSSVSTPVAAGTDFADSDKDAVTGAPTGAGAVAASVNQYPSYGQGGSYGTLIEEVVANRFDIEQIRDVHTMLWDADLGETLDVRNDAAGSEVSYESSQVPELHVHNWFQFSSGYWADLYQDVLVSPDRPALCIQNEVQFDTANEHTLFTLVNPSLDDNDSAGAGDDAYIKSANGYEFVVATDGMWYLAYAQHRPSTGKKTFDGHRIGLEGTTSGADRSAWQDIYVENDGYISENTSNSGNVDTGVGLYVANDTKVTWETVVGFGTSESEAIANATTTLDNGYATEKSRFDTEWSNWHAGVASAPTGDTTADEMYELSLTAMKSTQDPAGPTVAGLFEPHDDQYTYVWPRDQTIMIQSWLAAGADAEATAALQFLDDVQIKTDTYHDDPTGTSINRKGTWWQNYYIDGAANWEMLQLDQVGGPIYAHWLCWREIDGGSSTSTILDDHYAMSKLAAEFLLGFDNGYGFPKKHNDPWEENWGHTTEGAASAIAGLRCMAEMADSKGDTTFAGDCRSMADTWASNLDTYCYKTGAYLGDHYVTCDKPEWDSTPAGEPAPDQRPDAAAFMAHWPWNVKAADSPEMDSTVSKASDSEWTADNTPCLDRYPGDDYTPTDSPEDGGWPLCEAYADVVRWQNGLDANAVSDYVFTHAENWRTAGGLLPERVDGSGNVRWNSHLNWSQAMFVLLTESHARGAPFGYAPSS
ncbi:glycoside hydrolase family 15 protein [Haloarchaeobius sp. TZWWS8]|uniref:glycoside hydrolase family 15 protein n=1 Tax=Haloarchaeobius sp. TZWWS8 TaxID=3446121 RepID=UPI003EBD875D